MFVGFSWQTWSVDRSEEVIFLSDGASAGDAPILNRESHGYLLLCNGEA